MNFSILSRIVIATYFRSKPVANLPAYLLNLDICYISILTRAYPVVKNPNYVK